jgi:hypothetical protein
VAEVPFRLQFFDQFFERQILVSIGSQRGLAHPAEQFAETWIAGEVGAQHQGVGKEPDQVFHFRPVAIGNGRADHHVLLA